MDLQPEVIDLGSRLLESAARNGASAIADKVRSLRASGKSEETIAGLEEIISELISDKSELTRIAQSYQAELVSQNLASGDIRYIADTLFPLIEQIAESRPDADSEANLASLQAMKPLLSVETANVLQLLGFNFRRAIGEPLTTLCEQMITSRANQSEALKLESLKREQLYVQLALDPEAYERFRTLFGHS
jgi:hypothetical protein